MIGNGESVSDAVYADIKGAGDITYFGKPQIVETKILGIGDMEWGLKSQAEKANSQQQIKYLIKECNKLLNNNEKNSDLKEILNIIKNKKELLRICEQNRTQILQSELNIVNNNLEVNLTNLANNLEIYIYAPISETELSSVSSMDQLDELILEHWGPQIEVIS